MFRLYCFGDNSEHEVRCEFYDSALAGGEAFLKVSSEGFYVVTRV